MALSKPVSGTFSGRPREQARQDAERLGRLVALFPNELARGAVVAFYRSQPARDLRTALLPAVVLEELKRLNVDARVLDAAYQALDSAPPAQPDDTPAEAAAVREELVRYWVDGNAMAWTMLEPSAPMRLAEEQLLPVSLQSERWGEWETMMQRVREALLMTLALRPDDFAGVLGGFTAELRKRLENGPLELPDGLAVVRQAEHYVLKARN